MAYKKQNTQIATNVRGQCLEYSRTKVTSMYDIEKGDHLCDCGRFYDHHFIVTANYGKEERVKNGKELKIIEFYGPYKDAKAKVVTARKNLSEFTNLHKVNYLDGEAFDNDKVVERAIRAAETEKYSLIWNNCEHFANYCKTGKRTSIQVKNIARKAGGEGAARLIIELIRKIRKGKRATGKLSKAGVAITSAIEAVLAAEDVYRLYQMLEEGRISEEEFVKAVLHRLVTTVGSVWGSCVGVAIGSAAFGLPGMWFGGFVGNLVGGTILGLGSDDILSQLESYNDKFD